MLALRVMYSRHFGGLCALLTVLVLTAPAPVCGDQRQPATTPGSAFRVASNLVLINASVLDQAGRPVSGLDAGAFRLLEAGIEQKILSFNQSDKPVSIVLVVDSSRSMRKLIGRTAEAVSALLKTSNPEDEYSIVEFSDRPWLALGWTNDTSQVTDCLTRSQAQGNTALLDAVVFAGGVARRAANARRILIVISDGIDNHSRRSIASVKKYLLEANVQLYALELLNRDNPWTTAWDADGPALIQTLCEAGGGRDVEVAADTNLSKAIQEIAREIRNQYILSYQPTPLGSPGKYHSVELKLTRQPGAQRMSVSWRHGYYEPPRD